MGSAKEELDNLTRVLREGHVAPNEPCKVLFPRIEAKRRIRNKEGRTRLIVELDTPQTYSEFTAEFDRYKQHAGNVQVAFSIMLRCLKQLSNELIKTLAEDEPIQESLSDAD